MGHQRPYKIFCFAFLLRLGSNFLPPTDAVLKKKKTMEKGGGRARGNIEGRGEEGGWGRGSKGLSLKLASSLLFLVENISDYILLLCTKRLRMGKTYNKSTQ